VPRRTYECRHRWIDVRRQALVEEPVHLLLWSMPLVPGHEDGAGGMLQRSGQHVAPVWPIPGLMPSVREEVARLVEQGV
jgi:hypothetical protein